VGGLTLPCLAGAEGLKNKKTQKRNWGRRQSKQSRSSSRNKTRGPELPPLLYQPATHFCFANREVVRGIMGKGERVTGRWG